MTEPAAGSSSAAGSGQKGGPPGAGAELADQVAEQAQTGISSPDVDERAGQEAPASEGELTG